MNVELQRDLARKGLDHTWQVIALYETKAAFLLAFNGLLLGSTPALLAKTTFLFYLVTLSILVSAALLMFAVFPRKLAEPNPAKLIEHQYSSEDLRDIYLRNKQKNMEVIDFRITLIKIGAVLTIIVSICLVMFQIMKIYA